MPRPNSVLLVEDDDIEAEALVRGLQAQNLKLPIERARNATEALKKLRKQGLDSLGGSPLVLLDLNMPGMSGLEFLHQLRADPRLKRQVVFVLTTSSDPNDIARSYEHNVAGYIIKDEVGKNHAALAKLVASYKAAVTLP